MSTENPYRPPSSEVGSELDSPGELASRWRRLGGALIDGLVVGLITVPLLFVTGYIDRAARDAQSQSLGEVILLGLFGMVVFLVLNGHLLKNKGQTIGKLALGTQIVSVEDESLLPIGKIIGLRYAPVWIIGQIPGVGPIVSVVNAAFVFRGDKRCLHDLIAGTKVINYRAT